jgi:hypothetical protein
MRGVAIGRTEIIDMCNKLFGITSWDSVRRWRRDYKLPIRYFPNGKPYLIESEAGKFAIKYSEQHKKNRVNQ